VKQLEVTIMGHGYILGSPEGGESLLMQAVARVDQEMSHIRDSGKVKARERIAVLAALNLAYQLAEASTLSVAPPASAVRAADAQASTALPAADDLDLDALMQRVDAALGNDGQLL